MTWFKVDDGLAQHPKVLRIPRKQRASALGLWVLAGSWCARHLTDGEVPRHLLEELACPTSAAASLVAAGMWDQTPEGWRFHDWIGWQPTRAEKEAERATKAEAGRAGGVASGQVRRSKAEARTKQSARSKTNSRPDPTRPDPKEQELLAESGGHLRSETGDSQAKMTDLQAVAQALGSTEQHAADTAATVLAGRTDVQDPTRYVLAAIRTEPERYRPKAQSPSTTRPGDLCAEHAQDRRTCIHCRRTTPAAPIAISTDLWRTA